MAHQGTGDPRAQFLGFNTTGNPNVQAPHQGEEEKGESIALIKEITPGYGDGFIGAVLAACGDDLQRTTNLLLEGKFPAQLDVLDRQTGKAPGGQRATTETGDPRAAWMGGSAAADPPHHGVPPTAAAHKEHGAPQPHTAHIPVASKGVSQVGDPRVAWVRSGADTTDDEEGRYTKTGDPRAQ